MLDQMSINPLRACREFLSKEVIPRDLSINTQAFAATLEAMRRSGLIEIIRSPKCKFVST